MPYKVVYVPRWYDANDEDNYEDCEAWDTEQEALDFCRDMNEEEEAE